MIQFILRQARAQNVAAGAAIAAVAVIAAVTGPHLARLYDAAVAGCGPSGGCVAAFAGQDSMLRLWLGVLVAAVPGVLGMFWGAPLVARELEDGTFRLAWTQSVTRTRWLTTRLAVIGVASMAVAGLLSFIVTWWASPLDRAAMNQFGSFDERGIVPIGYAAFAFVLGVAIGALIRRTLPAMLATLAVFVTVQVAFRTWVRPELISPAIRSLALNPGSTGYGQQGFLPVALLSAPALQPASPNMPNAWITSIGIVNSRGAGLSASELARICPGIGSGRGGPATQVPPQVVNRMRDCVARVGATFHEVVSYQPASRYWPLQWYELVIFLGLALALATLSVWRIRRIG